MSSNAKERQSKDPDNYESRTELVTSAFEGTIEPVKVPLTYRIGILLVSIVMVILPLIYIALIGLVGYSVYYHTVNHVGMLEEGRGRGKFFILLLYLTPMIAGGFLFVFMFKPLFSRPARSPENRPLRRDSDPLLFGFVERICDIVQAPRPKSIRIDCEVNASASFDKGMLSMLGNNLVLTIGTPLVAGLNTRQFAGVLAHEFGHFAQGAGMRLTYIIRTISYWFTRVVYERDEWDERLIRWSRNIDLRLGWVFYVTRAFVWLTRKVLWCLMWVGHIVSGYMLRQMEFDADRYETRVAGSTSFEATARRLAVLNFANQGAQSDLGNFYREGRLGNDLARLIMANATQFDAKTLKKIDDFVDSQETAPFDTHPCDTDRIANAKREATEGIFKLEHPSSILFRDFDQTSRDATWRFYSNIFEEGLSKDQLHEVDELLERQKEENNSFEALHRCLQGTYSQLRPIDVVPIEPTTEIDDASTHIRTHRDKIIELAAPYKKVQEDFDKMDSQLVSIAQAEALLRAGFKLRRDTFDISLRNSGEVDSAMKETKSKLSMASKEMDQLESAAQNRLSTALGLLTHPGLQQKIGNAKNLATEVTQFTDLLGRINQERDGINTLRSQSAALHLILQQLSDSETTQEMVDTIKDLMKQVSDGANTINSRFATDDYPFDHATNGITIAQFLIEKLPDPENPAEILGSAEAIYSDLPRLQARILGRLCSITEQVEAALGLEPLDEPVEEDE